MNMNMNMIIENYGNYRKPGFGAHTLCVSWPDQCHEPKLWFSYETPMAFQYIDDSDHLVLYVSEAPFSHTSQTHRRLISVNPDHILRYWTWDMAFKRFLETFGLTLPTINLHLDEKKGQLQ